MWTLVRKGKKEERKSRQPGAGKGQCSHAQGSRRSNTENLPRQVSRKTGLRMPDSNVGEGHRGC